MTLRVYIAAPYLVRDELRAHADELELIGMKVTSRWLDEQIKIGRDTIGAATGVDDGSVTTHCWHDQADIDEADVLVMFTGDAVIDLLADGTAYETLHSGGRHVETGYALAKGKTVIVIGEPENVFHRGVCVVVSDWHRAVLELCRLARKWDFPRAEVAS